MVMIIIFYAAEWLPHSHLCQSRVLNYDRLVCELLASVSLLAKRLNDRTAEALLTHGQPRLQSTFNKLGHLYCCKPAQSGPKTARLRR